MKFSKNFSIASHRPLPARKVVFTKNSYIRLVLGKLSRSAERLKPLVTERQTFYPSQLRGYKKIGTEKWETDDELKAGMKGVNDNAFSDSWTPDEDRPSRR